MLALPTVLAIHERDITSDVCRRCAKCCEIDLQLPNTNSRYRLFLRATGFRLSPPPADGQDDCCDKVHDVTVHMGPCTHLKSEVTNGETTYACSLYGDPRRPQLCEDYNCVSWAKVNDGYRLTNPLLVSAEAAWRAVDAALDAGVR